MRSRTRSPAQARQAQAGQAVAACRGRPISLGRRAIHPGVRRQWPVVHHGRGGVGRPRARPDDGPVRNAGCRHGRGGSGAGPAGRRVPAGGAARRKRRHARDGRWRVELQRARPGPARRPSRSPPGRPPPRTWLDDLADRDPRRPGARGGSSTRWRRPGSRTQTRSSAGTSSAIRRRSRPACSPGTWSRPWPASRILAQPTSSRPWRRCSRGRRRGMGFPGGSWWSATARVGERDDCVSPPTTSARLPLASPQNATESACRGLTGAPPRTGSAGRRIADARPTRRQASPTRAPAGRGRCPWTGPRSRPRPAAPTWRGP